MLNAQAPSDSLPPLLRDSAFWGMSVTQFLGAFNDNLFKQLMLLLAIDVQAQAGQATDHQGMATVVFSAPFVLFSGAAGYLSDRYSKRRVIVLSKVAEIAAMLLGMAAFLGFASTGYAGLLVVLGLMGLQSTFFGPGKYGILPEMLREKDLPRANGIILMTTFLAIIFGTASAGLLGESLVDPHRELAASAPNLALGSAFCVLIALLGTRTSLMIRKVAPAQPDLPFVPSALAVPPETRRLLSTDRPLLGALLASSVFWLVSGIAIQAVNNLGLVQLQLNKALTSLMTAVIGLGIAVGAVIAGRLCGGRANFRVVRTGSWGLVVFMLVMSLSPGGRHLLGFTGSLPVLVLLGASAAFFAIPIQVFIQSRPPAGLKGRTIAFMNQLNFIAILISGIIYEVFDTLVDAWLWPRSTIFAMMAVMVLPVAVFYPRRDPHAAPEP